MHRTAPLSALALALAAALMPGCQDYSFNPVRRCITQPGTEQVTLSNVSAADVLFVVDDSGSMAGEQSKLATAFSTFIGSLNTYNQTRVASGLEPFDFHLAITTTSIFYNPPSGATCKATCGGQTDVCCFGTTTPQVVPKACPNGTGCTGSNVCQKSCQNHAGEAICCDPSGSPVETTTVPCDPTAASTTCGALQNRYVFNRQVHSCTSGAQCMTSPFTACVNPGANELGCDGFVGEMCCTPLKACAGGCDPGFGCGNCAGGTNVCCWLGSPTFPQGQPELVLACAPGVAQEGALYPHGSFVGTGSNPRVLHYDKQLYGVLDPSGVWTSVNPSTATNKQGFTTAQLNGFFSSNVNVGTCGSGQEQGLQAGRLAIAKALAGQQVDVVNSNGAVVDPPVTADWPHAGAKLVVVHIGDEDDCGSPEDPFRGVVLSGIAGQDTCVADAALPLAQQKEFRVDDIVSYLQSLNRPLGAAFIVSTAETTCLDASCTPGSCCDYQCTTSALTCSTSTCGGQAPGSRLLTAGSELSSAGADVVRGSICDPGAKACNGNGDCSSLPFDGGTTAPICSSTCQGAAAGSYCCINGGPRGGTLAGTTGFAPILSRIAEIVKPPSALLLPTQPASGSVTLLRVAGTDGVTRRICNGPANPPLTFQQAVSQGYDWWFTASRQQITDLDKTPSAASKYVYINHLTYHCEANPGESYSAEYLGLVPGGGCLDDAYCATSLGVLDPEDLSTTGGKGWSCFAGLDATGKCVVPSGSAVGTCVCGGHAATCPNG